MVVVVLMVTVAVVVDLGLVGGERVLVVVEEISMVLGDRGQVVVTVSWGMVVAATVLAVEKKVRDLGEIGQIVVFVVTVVLSESCWTVDSSVSTELREDWLPLRQMGQECRTWHRRSKSVRPSGSELQLLRR